MAACGTLAAAVAVVGVLPASTRLGLDWQPSLAWSEPWRWWTAAFVHYGIGHLAANLAGCAVLAAFGAAARLERRWVLAWAMAWPLGHLLLLNVPALAHYGGLSGLLHAGVAVAAVALLTGPPSRGHDDSDAAVRRHRRVGAAVAAGLLVKLLLEQAAGPSATAWPGIGVPVATAAHWSGALSGVLGGAVCASLTAWITRRGATIGA